jgi:hypothetical protein
MNQLTLDKDTKESLDTLIELLRLVLEHQFVETKIKVHTLERKRLIKEGENRHLF